MSVSLQNAPNLCTDCTL